MGQSISAGDFVHLFETIGPHKMGRQTGLSVRNIYRRRESLEKQLGRPIRAPDFRNTRKADAHPQRAPLDIENGHVLIGSDAHYWSGAPSPAHRGFVKFCGDLKPKAVIMNGDSLDGATISRHPPINWEARPSLIEEIEAVKTRHAEIEDASPPKSKLIWNLGNHDARFETRLATVVPEYARVHGFHLKDHFPRWGAAWSTWINDDVVVKHRYKGGVHATHNNTVSAGKSIVTGHLHSSKVTPYTDYTGTRYGVDTGCLADPHGPQFEYLEDNPRNWRSGFCVLTFFRGVLLPPELVSVFDANHIVFRGEVIRV